MATLRQYGVLVVGLLMAGGFAFGGMASYSQMINTGGGNSDGERMEAELPSQTFQEGPYNLSARERMYLSLTEDVVIVSAVYNSTEGREQMMNLKGLEEEFGGRVYISVVSAEDSEVANRYQITQFPKVLAFGFKTSRRQVPGTVDGDITSENVGKTICNVMRDWGSAATYCTAN